MATPTTVAGLDAQLLAHKLGLQGAENQLALAQAPILEAEQELFEAHAQYDVHNHVLATHAAALAKAGNSQLPISRLPQEVLFMVFCEVHSAAEHATPFTS